MKNRFITGILFVILGGLIAFGPITIFPICGVHSTQKMEEKDSGQKSSEDEMNMGSKKTDSSKEADEKSSMNMGKSMVMTCHWTGRAELGLGIVIAILGALLIIISSAFIRIGLSISLTLNGILTLLIPTYFIGVCAGVHMSCRSLTLPALIIVSSIVILAGVINTIYLLVTNRKEQVRT